MAFDLPPTSLNPGSNKFNSNLSDTFTLTISLLARYLWVTELALTSENNNFISLSINSDHLYLFSLLHHPTKYKEGRIESTFMGYFSFFFTAFQFRTFHPARAECL